MSRGAVLAALLSLAALTTVACNEDPLVIGLSETGPLDGAADADARGNGSDADGRLSIAPGRSPNKVSLILERRQREFFLAKQPHKERSRHQREHDRHRQL